MKNIKKVPESENHRAAWVGRALSSSLKTFALSRVVNHLIRRYPVNQNSI